MENATFKPGLRVAVIVVDFNNHHRAANNSRSSDIGQTKFTHVRPKPNCGRT